MSALRARVTRAPTSRRIDVMDQKTALAIVEQYLYTADRDVAHEIYHEDAVLEFPQSGERFEGVENFKEWRKNYPAKVEFQLSRLRGRDDLWVAEGLARYDDEGPWNYGVTILEFHGDKVAHETIYGGERWEAPEWRARWRAAPPREQAGAEGDAPARETPVDGA
jgi:hypothetical protein